MHVCVFFLILDMVSKKSGMKTIRHRDVQRRKITYDNYWASNYFGIIETGERWQVEPSCKRRTLTFHPITLVLIFKFQNKTLQKTLRCFLLGHFGGPVIPNLSRWKWMSNGTDPKCFKTRFAKDTPTPFRSHLPSKHKPTPKTQKHQWMGTLILGTWKKKSSILRNLPFCCSQTRIGNVPALRFLGGVQQLPCHWKCYQSSAQSHCGWRSNAAAAAPRRLLEFQRTSRPNRREPGWWWRNG